MTGTARLSLTSVVDGGVDAVIRPLTESDVDAVVDFSLDAWVPVSRASSVMGPQVYRCPPGLADGAARRGRPEDAVACVPQSWRHERSASHRTCGRRRRGAERAGRGVARAPG
jgi:hypothetical protein